MSRRSPRGMLEFANGLICEFSMLTGADGVGVLARNLPEDAFFIGLLTTSGPLSGATALQGDQYNRQLHPAELGLIVGPMSEEYANDYNAAHPDQPITQDQAETVLLQVALAKVDNQWAAKLGPGDPSAQAWLETHYNNLAFQGSDGSSEQVFTATDAEKNNFGMYADTYLSTFQNAVTQGMSCRYHCMPITLTTDNGLSLYNNYISSNQDSLTLDGLYLKHQVSTLTPGQADSVAWLGGLKPLLNWSTPPAGIVISLADQQYGQAVMQTAGLLSPLALEAAGLNATAKSFSVYDTSLWQSVGNNEPLTLQNLQMLYGEGNVVQGGGNVLQTAEQAANAALSYPDGLAYRLDLPGHLAGPDGFGSSGLSGTHNLDNATAALNAQGISYTLTPTSTDGISILNYDYTRASGKVIAAGKTVYDPAIFSDGTMLNMAQDAGQSGFEKYLLNPSATQFDVTQNGVNFRVYINFHNGVPYIGNVHPIK